MLTPQEVSNHAFAKAVMGGYNMAMVDEFLDELTDDYTSLYKENAALKAKMKVLVDKVEEYRSTEDAMRAALLTLKEYPVRGRRVAVLGDMFELGAITRQAHAEVGALAARCGVDLLLTVGGAMRTGRDSAAALGANAVHCRDKDEALARLRAYCRPGDAVLVKASHGMAFETILDGFYKAVPRD